MPLIPVLDGEFLRVLDGAVGIAVATVDGKAVGSAVADADQGCRGWVLAAERAVPEPGVGGHDSFLAALEAGVPCRDSFRDGVSGRAAGDTEAAEHAVNAEDRIVGRCDRRFTAERAWEERVHASLTFR